MKAGIGGGLTKMAVGTGNSGGIFSLFFGDGRDGSLVISTSLGLTSSVQYANLTFTGTGSLALNGYMLQVSGALSFVSSSGFTIDRNTRMPLSGVCPLWPGRITSLIALGSSGSTGSNGELGGRGNYSVSAAGNTGSFGGTVASSYVNLMFPSTAYSLFSGKKGGSGGGGIIQGGPAPLAAGGDGAGWMLIYANTVLLSSQVLGTFQNVDTLQNIPTEGCPISSIANVSNGKPWQSGLGQRGGGGGGGDIYFVYASSSIRSGGPVVSNTTASLLSAGGDCGGVYYSDDVSSLQGTWGQGGASGRPIMFKVGVASVTSTGSLGIPAFSQQAASGSGFVFTPPSDWKSRGGQAYIRFF